MGGKHQANALKTAGKLQKKRHGDIPKVTLAEAQVLLYDRTNDIAPQELYDCIASVCFTTGGTNKVMGLLIKKMVDNEMRIREIDALINTDRTKEDWLQEYPVGGQPYHNICKLRMNFEKRIEESMKGLGLLFGQTRGTEILDDSEAAAIKLMAGP